MKKIEKLNIYADEILGRDSYVKTLEIANKVDEIIDRLNAQPEEITHDIDKWRWGARELPDRLEVEDTTEEWEEEIRRLFWRMKYLNTEDYYEKKYVEELISRVKQLLDEAREGGKEEGGKGMLEGFLKHLENRAETEYSIRGEIELSKDLFKVYKMDINQDEDS